MRHRSLVLFFIIACAEGCAGHTLGVTAVRSGIIHTANPLSISDYALGPGDEIEIKFLLNPELNSQQFIRPDGFISSPYLENLKVAGLTVQEVETQLKSRYSSILLIDPRLAVFVKAFASNTVYVGGEVNTQGQQVMATTLTVSRAIIAAGGLKDTARAHSVLLIHQTSTGDLSWRVLDMKAALGMLDPAQDLVLRPHDIVYVPKSPIGDLDEFVDDYIRKLIPIYPSLQVNP